MLRILSWFYRFFWEVRKECYRVGWLSSKRLDAWVVCVGNLTAGGTGKTPMVIMLSEWFSEKGYKVSILTRGYRGKKKSPVTVVSDGEQCQSTLVESGDEALLMADTLSGVSILASADRYLAGLEALRTFSSEVLILDDGFQHFRLNRDLNLLLIDATFPFGDGALLPKGRLREPIQGLERADAVIVTRADQVGNTSEIETTVRRYHPSAPIFKAVHEAWTVFDPVSGESNPPECLRGRRVILLCGIGNPASFRSTLESLGADIADEIRFPDHHGYTPEDLIRIQEICGRFPGASVVTTEKDWIRLRVLPFPPEPTVLWVLKIKLKMQDPLKWNDWLSRQTIRRRGSENR